MKWILCCLLIGEARFELARAELREQELNAYRRVLMDWGGLTRYGSENAELRLKPGEHRVVFLGDEITENWGTGKARFFPGKPYLNRGITRQTTAQMLVRFRQDVIELKPAVVVIRGRHERSGQRDGTFDGRHHGRFLHVHGGIGPRARHQGCAGVGDSGVRLLSRR